MAGLSVGLWRDPSELAALVPIGTYATVLYDEPIDLKSKLKLLSRVFKRELTEATVEKRYKKHSEATQRARDWFQDNDHFGDGDESNSK